MCCTAVRRQLHGLGQSHRPHTDHIQADPGGRCLSLTRRGCAVLLTGEELCRTTGPPYPASQPASQPAPSAMCFGRAERVPGHCCRSNIEGADVLRDSPPSRSSSQKLTARPTDVCLSGSVEPSDDPRRRRSVAALALMWPRRCSPHAQRRAPDVRRSSLGAGLPRSLQALSRSSWLSSKDACDCPSPASASCPLLVISSSPSLADLSMLVFFSSSTWSPPPLLHELLRLPESMCTPSSSPSFPSRLRLLPLTSRFFWLPVWRLCPQAAMT